MEGNGFELSRAQTQALGTGGAEIVRTVRLAVPLSIPTNAHDVGRRLTEIVTAHEVLRARFVRPSGFDRWLQASGDPTSAPVPVGDGDDPATTPLDLEAGHCLAASLTADQLVLTAAAAVADEQSLRLIAAGLLDDAAHARLLEDPLQVIDYASWEAELAADDSADARIARAYWVSSAHDEGRDPAGDQLPVLSTARVEVGDADIDADHWLAAWAVLQARHSGYEQETATVCVAVDGRVDSELTTAVGPYERYVPLVLTCEPNATLDDLAVRVHAERSAAARFAAYAPAPRGDAAFSVRTDAYVTGGRGAFPLELVVVDGHADIWYGIEQVSAEHARTLAAQLRTLVADRSTPLSSVDVRTDAERARLTALLSGSGVADESARDVSVVAAVLAHATDRPDAPAIACGSETVSYAELDRRTAELAARLPGDATPVAVVLERGVDLVVAALAILRSGAPYLAIEPTTPDARLTDLLSLAGVGAVITSDALAARIAPGTPVVSLHGDDSLRGSAEASRSELAYLLFTSGSTGIPKAVAVSNANVLTYVRSVSRRLGIDASTRFAVVTGLSTDLGNTAVFGALVNGGTLEIVAEDDALDPVRFAAVIAAHDVTAVKTTPSHLRIVLASPQPLPLALLVLGGESLAPDLVDKARRAGVRRIVNHYGPTETTIGVLTHEVDDPAGTSVPLGRPLDHVRAHVLDQRGTPSVLGAVGELAIAGPAVTDGYLGDPELTAKRFVPEPGTANGRMYLTGDLVRVTTDADHDVVEFCGRADDQVKISGFRVQLGEIETALCAEPAIEQAATVVADDLLRAFVVAGPGFEAENTRARLASVLPAYLVPADIRVVDRIPLTASGKIDRRSLGTASASEPRVARSVAAPTTETESQLLAIWQAVLPGRDIGVDENFFQIGGHSLLATKVVARAQAHFVVDLPLHVIFASSTIAAMAAEIDSRRVDAESDDDLAGILAELESMSEQDAERLLGSDLSRRADDA